MSFGNIVSNFQAANVGRPWIGYAVLSYKEMHALISRWFYGRERSTRKCDTIDAHQSAAR